ELGCPFRAIVTERDSWQAQVSGLLQLHLSSLAPEDPYKVRSSDCLVEVQGEGLPGANNAFSVDVEELFYSVPHDDFLVAVREGIEASGTISFQNACGVTAEAFLEVLKCYLISTLVCFEGTVYVQKRGICIGSSVAPVLCEIFLEKLDRSISVALVDAPVVKICKYVDDFVVFVSTHSEERLDSLAQSILKVFSSCSNHLRFTLELPVDGFLQFLDVRLSFNSAEHVCWAYTPRTKKALLPYDSAHSKLIKRGIASLCLRSALMKFCPHVLRESFELQVLRLKQSGFPPVVLEGVAESLLKKLKNRNIVPKRRHKKFEVMPYVHKVSHNLKRVAAKFSVDVVFSAPCKLSNMCAMVSAPKVKKPVCSKKHAKQFVPCAAEVVYKIPLSCGRIYIGQTGRCLNDRLREHAASLVNGYGSHLPTHCKACGCSPFLDSAEVSGRRKGRLEREMLEAALIHDCDQDTCISVASVHLMKKEYDFIGRD
ncbi:unnamed protein product, partial [Ixodes hexagonus]